MINVKQVLTWVVMCLVCGAMTHTTLARSSDKQKSTAWLFGPTTTKGWIKYDDRDHHGDLRQRLRVQLTQADPDSDYPVLINGTQVGVVHTNSGGTGKLSITNQ